MLLGGGSTSDTSVAFCDLDIHESVVLRGVQTASGTPATSIRWEAGVVDAVFDLLGDYNGDGISNGTDSGNVDLGDYTVWQDTYGSTTDLRADGDDDGIIDLDDYYIWLDHYHNTLDLFDIEVL